MNEAQKRIMLIFTIIVLLLISAAAVSLLVIGYVSKDEMLKLAGTITTILSPSMLVGIAIKLLMNNAFHKSVKKTLNNAGISNIEPTAKEVKNNIAIYSFGNYQIIEKKNTIIIKLPYERINNINALNEFKTTLPYYVGKKREEIQN